MKKLYKFACTRSKEEYFGLEIWAFNTAQAIKRAEKMLLESGYRAALIGDSEA